MADINIPRNHHWVPQFYLKYFTPAPNTERPRIYVTNKDAAYKSGTLLSKTEKILDVASSKDMYNGITLDGALEPSLERWLGGIEKEAGEVWRRLFETNSLDISFDSRDRLIISAFLAAQHLRVPRMIGVVEHALRGTEKEIDIENLTDLDVEKVHKAVEAIDTHLGESKVNINFRKDFREMIPDALLWVQGILADMKWSMLVFERADLVTSDSPLYVINGNDFCAWALGKPESLVYFPMTRKHVLVLTGSAEQNTLDGTVKPISDSSVAGFINSLTLHFAASEVYSAVDLKNKFEVLR